MFYQHGSIDYGLSDHALIYTARKRKKLDSKVGRIKCRNYRKFDENKFRSHIETTDWSDVINSQDNSVATMLFHEIFCTVTEIYAPFKTIHIKENAPAWVNGEYLGNVDEKKHAC